MWGRIMCQDEKCEDEKCVRMNNVETNDVGDEKFSGRIMCGRIIPRTNHVVAVCIPNMSQMGDYFIF